GQRHVPRERDAGRVDRAHREEDERGQAEDGGGNVDDVGVDLEPGEKTPHRLALEHASNEHADAENDRERDQPEERDVVAADVEERSLEEREVHATSLGELGSLATAKHRRIKPPNPKHETRASELKY